MAGLTKQRQKNRVRWRKLQFRRPQTSPTQTKVHYTYTSRGIRAGGVPAYFRHVEPCNSRIPTCGQTNGLIKSSALHGVERRGSGTGDGARVSCNVRPGRGGPGWIVGMVSYLGARVARAQIYAMQAEIYAARMHMHFPRWRRIWNFSHPDRPLFPLIVFSALAKIMRYCWRTSTIAQTEAIVGKNAQWGPFVPYAGARTRVRKFN